MRNSKTASNIAGQNHVYCLIRRTWIEDGCDGIDTGQFSIRELEPCRCIHPGISCNDKPCRGSPTNPEGERAEPVRRWRQAAPAIEINAEENCFDEKSKALKSKQRPNNRTCIANIGWPQQTQFKLDNCARNRTDGKDDSCSSRPAPGQRHESWIFFPESQAFCNAHHQW